VIGADGIFAAAWRSVPCHVTKGFTMSALLSRLSSIAVAAALVAACGGGGGDDDGASPGNGNGNGNGSGTGTPGSGTSAAIVAGEVVVNLRDPASLAPLLSEYGLSLLDQFGRRPIYRLRAAAGADVEALAARLAADARVLYAEPNLQAETPEGRRREAWAIGGDAGTYATQWNTRALRLPEAHAINTGSGVTVAVLDTGVEATHPALSGRLVAGFDFVDFDAVPDDAGSTGDRGYGHGTHVASLVAQVAPAARIMPVRVLDRQGVGNIWVLAEGLLHAVDPDGVPSTDDGAQVINLSLGTTRPTRLLEDIIERVSCGDDYDDDDDDGDDDVVRCAAQGGAVVVSAAGNAGDTTRQYPAGEQHSGALAVAASTEAGTLATFSTRGDWVQVAAPGELIYGAVPGAAYGVWSGTSMAAPMTAGAAALLRSRFPAWKPSDVTSKLVSNGRQLCGSPLKQIDAAAALDVGSGADIACP
jgi:subtilisin family serine protease